MRSAIAFAALASVTLAAPHTKRASCEFSPFESANLLHGHDVNSGKIKFGGTILDLGIAFMGNKCSPAWAVGGAIDDATPTVYTGTVKQLSPEELNKLLGPFANILGGTGANNGDLSGLLGGLGGAGGAGGYGDLAGLLGGLGGAGGAGGAAGGLDLSSILGALGGAYGV